MRVYEIRNVIDASVMRDRWMYLSDLSVYVVVSSLIVQITRPELMEKPGFNFGKPNFTSNLFIYMCIYISLCIMP